MKKRRTFRALAKSERARKKLMNFTGTGAGEIAAEKMEKDSGLFGGVLRGTGRMFRAPLKIPKAVKRWRQAAGRTAMTRDALKAIKAPPATKGNPFAPPPGKAERMASMYSPDELRELLRVYRSNLRASRSDLFSELLGTAGAGAALASPYVLSQAAKSVFGGKQASVKVAEDPPQRGFWERAGRSAVGLYDDPTASQIWQQQAQAYAQQLAQEQGIPAQQALPMAIRQMSESGMTPQSMQREMLETDTGDRTALTGQVRHWLNPMFNPVLNPGYVASQSLLEGTGVGGEGVGGQLLRGFGPYGAQLGMQGLARLGVPGMRAGAGFLGQIPGTAAAGKFLLPAYMAARTAVDPRGIRGIAESVFTGKAPEFNRVMQAQAMRDALGGQKMKDTWFGGGAQQIGGALTTPASYLHDILPVGDLAGLASSKLGGPSFNLSSAMNDLQVAGQASGERSAIRGGATPSAKQLFMASLGPLGVASAGLDYGLNLYSKYGLGDVSGYDPFYRQRWAANTLSQRMDDTRRQQFAKQLQGATGSYGDPESMSNQLWLSQMKRMGELSPFGAKGTTWSRDPLTSSYKATDADQTEVDPSQSVWQRSLADATQLAKERGMSVEQVLMGRDARAAAADDQNASQFLAKAQAVEAGNVQGMDPTEVKRIQNFIANTKAQGGQVDEQAAKGFVMQRRRQRDIDSARAAGKKPGAQDVGRNAGYSWWRKQLAEGKGYSPYESLSSRANTGSGFDKDLFDQLVNDEVIGQIKNTRGYQHAQSGIRGAFSGAQLEQFLADKDPHELQRLYGTNSNTIRELHQVNRQDYLDTMNLANRRMMTGAGRAPTPKADVADGAGSTTYQSPPKKNTGEVAAVAQNASGKGDGSRV